MTVQERIKESEIFRFLEKNRKRSLKGTELTPMQMVDALVNADLLGKKSANVTNVCEYLRERYNIPCDDQRLYRVVENAYKRMIYFEKNDPGYDFSELPKILKPLYQRLFQRRMQGDFD